MENRRDFLFLLLWSVILIAGTSQTYGQRACIPIVGYQDLPYWRADSVFIGTVVKFTPDTKTIPRDKILVTDSYQHVDNSVRFAVQKKYRGKIGKNIEIVSTFNFKEGEQYFVYAINGKDQKVYQLDNRECGRPPMVLKDAQEDLEYAEEIAEGKLGTRIFGFVFEDHQTLGAARQNIPLENIEVTIRSEKHSFSTKTDEKGKYLFTDIPPAEYNITAATPDGLRRKYRQNPYLSSKGSSGPGTVLLGKGVLDEIIPLGSTKKPRKYYRHSDSYNFLFSSLSSIEGTAIDHDGKIPPQQYMLLIPMFNGEFRFDNYIQYVWTSRADGKFVFENVPKGQYMIVVNRYNCHSDNHPEYARNFFPGASEEKGAEIITVGENQDLKVKDFRLSQPLKERRFSGVVLDADRHPLANATVFIRNAGQTNSNRCFGANVETKTDESGHFELRGYQSYKYAIRAYIQMGDKSPSMLLSETIELPTEGDVENIELVVDRGTAASIVPRNRDPKPGTLSR